MAACTRRADPDVIASPALREPLAETFAWLTGRIAEVLAEGQRRGEFTAALDPAETAAAVVAVVQGGYVLARSADSAEPFDRAVRGALALLAAHA
ncbi:TetR family transcriptional regulator C-terminal domain-containing protein [Peterkaempfera bronchialis]|uniref:TetR family transcriptional regulator C-terminal domain-containing protein n=1 Tax=Peterkaempfera bronchialis TaxID=2126346 RepID=UPI00389ACF07